MPEKDKKTAAANVKGGKIAKPEKKKRKSPLVFFREVINEIKKVTWPTKKEWINHTIVVTVFVVVMTAVVGLIDLGLSKLIGLVI